MYFFSRLCFPRYRQSGTQAGEMYGGCDFDDLYHKLSWRSPLGIPVH